jgi:hypothetical protein
MATIRPISMALTIPRSMSPAMLRKLHALAEQRCAYFIELHQSGRWRHYYTPDELAAQMREAAHIAERFQQMLDAAGVSSPEPVPNVFPLFAKAS